MSEQSERFAQALEWQAKIFGEEAANRLREGSRRGYRTKGLQDFTELTIAHTVGDVWSRPGLDLRSRSIAQIAGLMGMRQWDELEAHIRLGLRNGLTPDEIMEVLLQINAYGGSAMGHSAVARRQPRVQRGRHR